MEQQLVSIVVITYNSAKTVIETLDSTKNQTYKNIELIVSDDCSTDNTVEICKNWIEINKDRFFRTELLTVEKNTGVPGNCNRGIRKCSSEWIKLIAGDDILLSNCINDFISYINSDRKIDIIYSLYYSFNTKNGEIVKENLLPIEQFNKDFSNKKLHQLKTYLGYGINITPSLFFKKELIEKMGYYNEKYRLFEDTPMISKILSCGIYMHFLNKPTVLYRKDNPSITHLSNNKHFYKRNFLDTVIQFRKDQVYTYYKKTDFSFWIKEISFLSTYYFTIYVLQNKKNNFTLILYYIFKGLNPYYWYEKIKRATWL